MADRDESLSEITAELERLRPRVDELRGYL